MHNAIQQTFTGLAYWVRAETITPKSYCKNLSVQKRSRSDIPSYSHSGRLMSSYFTIYDVILSIHPFGKHIYVSRLESEAIFDILTSEVISSV